MYSQPQGIQRRPDGTSAGAENLLHQRQLASNNDMHPTLHHRIPNDPFIESAADSRFRNSAIGLYGSEARGGLYNFGGHSSQHDGMHQIQGAHRFDPGSSSSANFASQFNELGSRAQSIPPGTLMIGEHSRGLSIPPAPTMQPSTSSFHNTLPHDSVSANPFSFQQMLTEIRTTNNRLNHVESTIQSILDRMQQNENTLKELQETIDAIAAPAGKNTAGKNISNQHPKLREE